jgi:3-hydroxyacyl-CoA dehydrogenase/enoyl-CoA hydratase/3-hydroxybutyryl-CoA epimerase
MTQETADIRWERDDEGVVTLTMDAHGKSANTMDERFAADFASIVARLTAEQESITGVILTSAKRSFFAGGDLGEMLEYRPEDASRILAHVTEMKGVLRRLETLSVPVVAAINGAALGGGLEIALACHRRIAVDDARVRIGLPEVTLGLLPGGGGVTRTVRILGLERALGEVLLDGVSHPASRAHEIGLVDELAPDIESMMRAAKNWIASGPEPVQPWDRPGYVLPGAAASDIAAIAHAQLTKKLRGAPYPAPHAILASAFEGAKLDFDSALLVESRYFISLATGQIAKNMIRGEFLDAQEVRSGRSRPVGIEAERVGTLGVVGAGMMGAGIAYAAAKAGIQVVLHDVTVEAADRGKAYSRKLVDRASGRGQLSAADADALVARITTTDSLADLAGVDAVIEAVFETPDLKRGVYRQLAEIVPEVLLASNTSTLPISELAAGTVDPSRFIGMHFFSPVDKMPLIEIVVGAETSDETLAHAFDLALALGKVPIVVNDSRGFFTSRVITQHIDEAIALVGEGVPVPLIERAATENGYPVGPLQLTDETSLSLPHRVRMEAKAVALADGTVWEEHPAEPVMTAMVDTFNRPGRAAGAGFFEYVDGVRTGIWPGIAEHYGIRTDIPLQDVKDRLIFVEALEAVDCLEEGVVRSIAEGNVGSLLGIGFPRWTGGVFQFVNGYPGGIPAFVRRADELADAYGERFRPSDWLRETAEAGVGARLERAGERVRAQPSRV